MLFFKHMNSVAQRAFVQLDVASLMMETVLLGQ